MATFFEASQVKACGSGRFTFQPTADWLQGRTLFGGLIVGAATRALLTQISPARALRSLMVSFIAPVRDEEASIETRIHRKGKALTHAEAKVIQGEQVCTIVQGSFGAAHQAYISITPPPAPPLAAPEKLREMPSLQGITPTFADHFSFRWDDAALPLSGAAEARCRGWVRYRAKHRIGLPELLGLIDAWPPPIITRATTPLQLSSVTWMVNLLPTWPEEGVGADAWWRYDAQSTAASEGYSDTSGGLWDAQGQLVAYTRQLAVAFLK